MSKKLLLIIVIFLGVLILTSFTFTQYKDVGQQQKPVHLQETVTPEPISTISFAQNPIITTHGATTSADIIFESHGPLPEIIQIELEYDPTMLNNMQLIPGTLFEHAKVALQTIDPATGRISFAVEPQEKPITSTTEGVLATLTFIPTTTSWKQETYLNFLPKTNVKTTTEENTLSSGYGVRVLIQ
jgi:hypothetical protein